MSEQEELCSGPDCQKCRAAADTNRALGMFAESLEKAIADGVFERLGREYGRRREEAFWKAFIGLSEKTDIPIKEIRT